MRLCPIHEAAPSQMAIDPFFTYQELDRLIAKGCKTLCNAGLTAGDLIVLRAAFCPFTLCALFSAWRLSLYVALIPNKLPADAEKSYLSHLPVRFKIENPKTLYEQTHCLSSQPLLNLSIPSLMLLTSGSCSQPKWASFTLQQLFQTASVSAKALKAEPKQRWLLSLPLHHVGGLSFSLRAFLTEGTLLFANHFDTPQMRIIKAKADFTSLVPTQLYRLLHHSSFTTNTHLLIGGAPLAKSLYEKALSQKLSLSLSYGLTEMSSTVLLTCNPKWKGSFPCLGDPLEGKEIYSSNECELAVRGEGLFYGYGYASQRKDKEFKTGDLGDYTPSWGWRIFGRKDLQFICGGENIQPEEIEIALLSHPNVEEAIVVPRLNDEYGASPVAFVRSSLSENQLKTHLESILPPWKIPKNFLPLSESASLKPNRNILFEKANKNLPELTT